MSRNLNYKTFSNKNVDLFDLRAKVGTRAARVDPVEIIKISLSRLIDFVFQNIHKLLICNLNEKHEIKLPGDPQH